MPITNHEVVGPVSWERLKPVLPGGQIHLDPSWTQQNLDSVLIPSLRGVETYAGSFNGWVKFYVPAIPQLEAVFKEIAKWNLTSKILFWGGTLNFRLIRGSTVKPSNHAFGTAMDLNPQQNWLGNPPAPWGSTGSVRELVPYFKDFGFSWGGDYKKRPDGMHFEVARLKAVTTPQSETHVAIYLDEAVIQIAAFFHGDATWVGVRDWLKVFGGTFIRWIEPNMEMELPDGPASLKGTIVDSVGYVKVRDLLPHYPVNQVEFKMPPRDNVAMPTLFLERKN